uniref:Uncharacterized protein n=1 Tax=Arundo donax TaxID=35708 RepID=A0A0A9BJL7_ARUDO
MGNHLPFSKMITNFCIMLTSSFFGMNF